MSAVEAVDEFFISNSIVYYCGEVLNWPGTMNSHGQHAAGYNINRSEAMKQTGQIIEFLPDNKALVAVHRASSCDKCGACGILTPGSNMEFQALLPDNHSFKLQDRVMLEMPDAQFYKASSIVFVPMIVGLMLGAVLPGMLAEMILDNPGSALVTHISVAGAIAGFVAGLILSRILERNRGETFIPRVTGQPEKDHMSGSCGGL